MLVLELLHEANGNTVLLRGSIWVGCVTLEGRRNAGSINTSLDKLVGNNLSSLLRKEEVSLSSTGSLVSVAGELNLGLRVLCHECSDLIELGNLRSLDVPLVDDEVDVLLELNWSWCWSWLNNDWLWFRLWLWSWCRSWCRRDYYWSWSSLLGKIDLDADETGPLIVAVERELGSSLILLRVEVIAECIDTTLDVELDSVGKTDIEAESCTACAAELGVIPEILEFTALSSDSDGLIVVETGVAAESNIYIWTENTVSVNVEHVSDVECSVESSLSEIELVNLGAGGETVHCTLGLPTHEVATKAEYWSELITYSKVSCWGEELGPSGLTDSLGSTTTELNIPAWVELLCRSADTDHQSRCKYK